MVLELNKTNIRIFSILFFFILQGSIRLSNCDWSEDFSMSAVGDENHVNIVDQHDQIYTVRRTPIPKLSNFWILFSIRTI